MLSSMRLAVLRSVSKCKPHDWQLTEIQIVELILDKHDAPQTVKTATAAVEEFNKKK